MTLNKLIITLALFSIFNSFSQNNGKNFIDQPFIEVTGKVETKVIPNEIYLNILLNENDTKGKVSIEQQENQMISILRALQIDMDSQFSILDYNGYFKKKFLSDNEVTKAKRYQLIIDSGECLGKVYEALGKINISNISIIKTSHSDIEKLRRNTKLKAIKVAKEKADAYAQAIEQTIGKALFIQEVTNYSNNNMNRNELNIMNEVVVTGYSTTKIQNLNIKSITISETILAKFILN